MEAPTSTKSGMRAFPPSIAALVAGLGLAASACSSSASCAGDASAAGDGASADGGGDATGSTESDGAGANPVMDSATPQPVTAVRVANWSPDSPAVDFCLSPHGTTAFQGPLLRGLAAQEAEGGLVEAGSPALAFPEVSSYSFVGPDQYDVRMVVAGASDCTVGITADATNLPPLGPGTFNTIALVGEANPVGAGAGLETVAFEDAAGSGPAVAVRFINAAANVPAASFGSALAGGSVAEVFTNVQFGQAGTLDGQTPDAGEETPAQTYASLMSPSGLTFVVSSSSGTPAPLATANNVTIAEGAVVTLALIGPTGAIDGGIAVQLLECVDNAGTVGLLGNCQIISQ